jgi:tight adherence protein C
MQQAFDEFILRTGLEDFKSLTVAINQSIQLGTSIAETLRVYADEYRIKRKQEAEEMAAKVGTKMIFPLVTMIWPSFFIVAIGPALIKVFRVFGNM